MRVGVGHQTTGKALALGRGVQVVDAGAHRHVAALQAAGDVDLGQRPLAVAQADVDERVGLGVRAQAAGVSGRRGIHLEHAAGIQRELVLGLDVGACSDGQGAAVVQVRGGMGPREVDQAAAVALRENRARLVRERADGDVVAGPQERVAADADGAGRVGTQRGLRVAHADQPAAAVGRAGRGIALGEARHGDVGRREVCAAADRHDDVRLCGRTDIGAADPDDAAARAAGRRGDDPVAGRRAGQRPCAADAIEDLRAAAVGGDVDHQPVTAAAPIRQVDAFLAERAGTAEHRPEDNIGRAQRDDAAAGRREQPEAVSVDVVDVIGDAVHEPTDGLVGDLAQAVQVVLGSG